MFTEPKNVGDGAFPDTSQLHGAHIDPCALSFGDGAVTHGADGDGTDGTDGSVALEGDGTDGSTAVEGDGTEGDGTDGSDAREGDGTETWGDGAFEGLSLIHI